MKELSIEEKARAYDEAKLRMSAAYNSNRCTIGFMNEIFPELRESEDERIRKFLHHTFTVQYLAKDGLGKWHGEPVSNILAWLEKQKVLTTEEDLQGKEDVLWCIKQAKKYAKNENEMGTCWFAEKWLEKQGKNNMGISEATKQKLEDNLNKALEKETPESCNEFLDEQGEPTEINPSEFDSRLNRLLGQFETLPKEELASSLSFYLNVVQNDGTYKDKEKQGEQKPTVEMKTPEESLGIDSDTYNKIVDECVYGEQKPESEEDTQYINDTLALLSFGCSTHSVGEVKEWLQSLNNRVQPKQEWSEEDEKKLNTLIGYIISKNELGLKYADWLKSLKDRYTWKPSDEQMEAISAAINVFGKGTVYGKYLIELREQLNKLKEE